MRAFIAVEIEEGLKEKISKLQKKLEEFSDIKLVEKENLHFCLKFLGEIEEKKIEEIKECMNITAKEFEKFEIDLNGIGAFPSLNYVKVAWIGVKEGKETLIGIAERIDQLLEQIGFEKEKRGFIPHLTLGRVKNVKRKLNKKSLSLSLHVSDPLTNVQHMKETMKIKGKKEFRKFILDNKNIEIGKTGISRIVLFKSILENEGPVYEKIYEVKLG